MAAATSTPVPKPLTMIRPTLRSSKGSSLRTSSMIRGGDVKRRGQLTLQAVDDAGKLGSIAAANQQGRGAEHLFRQLLILQKGFGAGAEQARDTLIMSAGLRSRLRLHLGVVGPGGDTRLISLMDPRRQHGRGRSIRDGCASRFNEQFKPLAFDRDQQAGLVQNCPAPIVSEPTKLCAIASARWANAPGNRITGLIELISA